MDKNQKEQLDVLSLDSVVEPVTLTILVVLLVVGRFLKIDESIGVFYYATVIIGFIFTVVWYHLYPLKNYNLKRISFSIPLYSLLIALLSHLTGGIDTPLFPAFFMPIIVAAYGLPPFYVTIATIIPSLFIALELALLSYSSDIASTDDYAYGVVKSVLIILIATFAYFLSGQRIKDKELLDEAVTTLGTKDLRQKEAITELIDTERRLRLQQQQLEVRNKELETMRRSMLNILEDLEHEREHIELDRNRFEAVLQSTSEGIMMIDQEKHPVLVNKSFEKMFGLDESKLIGAEPEEYIDLAKDFFKNEDELELWKEEVTDNRITRELDWEVDKKPPMYVKRFTTPVQGKKRTRLGRIWTFRDVTRDKEIDNMRSEFVSLASHQLRTPLSAIKWFLEIVLNEEVGKLKPKQKELLEKTYESSERMVELVNALLNISRIESGRISVNPEPTDVVEITQSAIDQITPLVKLKKHKVTFSYDKKIPEINLDKRLVGESISNLISNAVKYTPEKGKIDINVDKKKTTVEISVKDNGYGIPKKEQYRVFEKFYRSDKAITSETEGTGLGLFIVKSVIESSGGRVWFDSAEGKGSTFYISLPLTGSKKVSGEKSLS